MFIDQSHVSATCPLGGGLPWSPMCVLNSSGQIIFPWVGWVEDGDEANFLSHNSYLFRNYHVSLFGTTFGRQVYCVKYSTSARKICRFHRNKVKYVLRKRGHVFFFFDASKLSLRGIHVCFPSPEGQRTTMIIDTTTTVYRYHVTAAVITTTIKIGRVSNGIQTRHVCYCCYRSRIKIPSIAVREV